MSRFTSSPMHVVAIIKELPPYEINGSGIPTTGKSPITMHMLIATCKKNKEETPSARILQKWLFTFMET
jgi:hypothetical protein